MPFSSADRLGILGAGNMAEALTKGVIRAGLLGPEQICAADPSAERRELFASFGAGTTERNEDIAECEILLLSVKPQIFEEAVGDFGKKIRGTPLVISIAAGVNTGRISALLPDGARIVRVMPNTPMMVGKGVAGVARGPGATDADVGLVLELFRSAGIAREVAEELIDPVTALSGSGPAFLFRYVEAMAAAGTEIGLPPEIASEFALATVTGSSVLLEQSKEGPKALREKVTSPGGTTEAGLLSLEQNRFEQILADGVEAACKRSMELGR